MIPKAVFEALRLEEGDFVEVTAESGCVSMKPKKLIDADDVLTPEEAKKVRRAMKQMKQGRYKLWRDVKDELAR